MGSTGKMKRASRSLRPVFCRDLIFVFLMLSKGKCGKSGNNNKQQHQEKKEKKQKHTHMYANKYQYIFKSIKYD